VKGVNDYISPVLDPVGERVNILTMSLQLVTCVYKWHFLIVFNY